MRLPLAILTSALLATAASAQSVYPGLSTPGPVIALAPETVVPAVPVPTAIVSVGVDRADIAPAAKPASPSAPVIAAVPAAPTEVAKTPEPPATTHFTPAAKPAPRAVAKPVPRTVVREVEAPRRTVERVAPPAPREAAVVYRARPSGRDLGRFWPPVF